MKEWVEFGLKIINRVSIFQDFLKLFVINRSGFQGPGGTPLPKVIGWVPPPVLEPPANSK